MSTFTTVALENLLEPTVRISLKKPLDSVEEPTNDNPEEPNPRHLYISPALYATPEQAPIAEYSSPDPLWPSPYVVNHKRRRGGNESRSEVTDLPFGDGGSGLSLEEVMADNFVESENVVYDDVETMSMGSEAEEEEEVEVRQMDSQSFVSVQGEFFDANDDFSCDVSMSSIRSYGSRMESELQSMRVSLSEESEKRKIAEETLFLMQCQWERINKLMSQAGFTFPAPPTVGDRMELGSNLLDQFSQEFVTTRFVSEAIGRGEARAEAEEAFASIIESKDQEIHRLQDRLQYYETVNHEMSQRKLVEVARRQQERKKSHQRRMWGITGLSIAAAIIGASLVAHKYVPQTSKRPYLSLLKSSNLTNASNSVTTS